MGRGKFKGKPTGRRQFSTPEEIVAGSSNQEAEYEEELPEEESGEESGEESEEDPNRKGTPHTREEIEKQKARERYMKLQEQGKPEQARKDLECICLLYVNKGRKLLRSEKKRKPPKKQRRPTLTGDLPRNE